MPNTYQIPSTVAGRATVGASFEKLRGSSVRIALSSAHNPIGQVELGEWRVAHDVRLLGKRVLEVTVTDFSGSEQYTDDAERPSTQLRIPLGATAILGRAHHYSLPSLEAAPTSEKHLFVSFTELEGEEWITVTDPISQNGSRILDEGDLLSEDVPVLELPVEYLVDKEKGESYEWVFSPDQSPRRTRY